MNIADILAEAAEEVYEAEVFETNLEYDIDVQIDEANLHTTKVSAASILKQSAQIVANEDKKAAEKIFSSTATDIGREMEINEKVKPVIDVMEKTENILIEASREVENYYSHNTGGIIEKRMTIEQSSSDEDDDNDIVDDPELNAQLIYSAFNGKVESVQSLLAKGSNYCSRDRHGWTALHWAASKGFDEIIEVLFKHVRSKHKSLNKFVNAQDFITGFTALHVACISGHVGIVKLLLANKADRNKFNFLKELAVDCIGKVRGARNIRELLQDGEEKDHEEHKYERDTIKKQSLHESGQSHRSESKRDDHVGRGAVRKSDDDYAPDFD